MRERKDRLVQTRVPERLETTLRKAADKKGTTVSQLIRGVLEDAFDFVDGVAGNIDQIVNESVELAQRLSGAAPRRAARGARTPSGSCGAPRPGAAKKLADVAAWQEVILNQHVRCARCGAALHKGARALHGVHAKAGKAPAWLCAGGLAAGQSDPKRVRPETARR